MTRSMGAGVYPQHPTRNCRYESAPIVPDRWLAMPAIPARVLRHESLGVRAYVLLNVVLPSQQSLDRGATPALVSVGRCQSVFYGAFAGGLEDDPSGHFDGVVGEAFVEPAQQCYVDRGCHSVLPFMVHQDGE